MLLTKHVNNVIHNVNNMLQTTWGVFSLVRKWKILGNTRYAWNVEEKPAKCGQEHLGPEEHPVTIKMIYILIDL